MNGEQTHEVDVGFDYVFVVSVHRSGGRVSSEVQADKSNEARY